jgi:HlyD family secretion protein
MNGRVNDQVRQERGHRLQIPNLERAARIRRIVMLVVLALGIAAGVVWFTRPEPVIEVYRTDGLKRRTLVQVVEASGSLDVRSRVEVPAPIAGRLTAVHVQTGQRVEAAAPLASLDERAAELTVKSAEAAVEAAAGRAAQARAALEEAKRNEAQVMRLREKGLSSDHELSQARSAKASAQAVLEAGRAEQKLASQSAESAKLGKSLGRIVAPASGIVLRAPEHVGAAVAPERGPLFVIGEPLDVMRIDAPVSETEIALLKPGMKAEVVVQALPGRKFAAEVSRIGIEPSRQSGVVMYPVTLLVQNPDAVLLPGMSARVRLEVARAENVLSIHEAALRFTPVEAEPAEPRSRVWVRRDPDEVEAVAVTAGVSDGVHTELRAAAGAPELPEATKLAIGLLNPDTGPKKATVSLGKKK